MKTNKLVSCPQCGGFGFTSTPVSTDYEITVCRAKTCELCHGAGVIEVPMTNADRIRAMSDEELAKLLCCTGWRMIEQKECLEWLQQSSGEEDKHEQEILHRS